MRGEARKDTAVAEAALVVRWTKIDRTVNESRDTVIVPIAVETLNSP